LNLKIINKSVNFRKKNISITFIKDIKFGVNLKWTKLIHFNQNWDESEQK